MRWWLIGLVLMMLLCMGAFLAFSYFRQSDSLSSSPSSQSAPSTISEQSANLYAKQIGADKNCKGEGPVNFTHPPMKPEDVAVVLPYGLLAGGHVTPIDHMYFSPKNFQSPPDTYPVYAIADGTIGTIGFRAANAGEAAGHNPTKKGDYRLDLYYNCTFFSYYDLITSLSAELAAQVPSETSESWHKQVKIPVKAGQEIGRIGGQTLDWAVYNQDVTLPGLLIPEHYDREPWKIHTDYQSLDYFVEPIKTEIYRLLARQVEPRIGKIDYDVDGKVVGNWFLEGTNGYAGAASVNEYWGGHLAVVPDYIDPTHWHFSIGAWPGSLTGPSSAGKTGQPAQFGIEPGQDPQTVGIESGIQKYELHQSQYVDGATGEPWLSNEGPIADPRARVSGPVQGTVLLQLVEPRKLKVETFPGKTADQVNGFTAAAKIYER